METKEFNLSDKIKYLKREDDVEYTQMILKTNVKEFIRRLKDGLFGGKKPMEDNEAIRFIDNLAGEELK